MKRKLSLVCCSVVILSAVAWPLIARGEPVEPRDHALPVVLEVASAASYLPRRRAPTVVEETKPIEETEPERAGVAVVLPRRVEDEKDEPRRELEVLGELLFHSKLLSENDQISCATCHDPDKHFADGLPQSKGILDIEVGANSPSLVASGMIVGFPAISKDRSEGMKAVTLEERCVAPIVNPLEMGSTIAPVLTKLGEDVAARTAFAKAFPGTENPVTEETIGKALAAFVRSLRPERSQYHRYLDGEWGALTTEQKAGLEIFHGSGKCGACHSGEAFSDGLVHFVRPVGSARTRDNQLAHRKRMRELAKKMRHSGPSKEALIAVLQLQLGAGGGYGGGGGVVAQTVPLWDVARTAPYFRDGSEPDLEVALKTHIAELREAKTTLFRVRQRHRTLVDGRRIIRDFVLVPDSLRPTWREGEGPPRPANLAETELGNLLAFLEALSPPTDNDERGG